MTKQTILVVEDNPITRKMLRVTLQTGGYVVAEAPDGGTALDLVAGGGVSLVIQDLLLPDMDGFELAARIRSHPNGREVPIIAVSGFASGLERIRLSSGEFTDFIMKPVEPSILLGTVLSYLPASDADPGTLERGRLLLVDDDPIQRKLARMRLAKLGFTVSTAQDGAEALEALQRERPDVIVSDVMMPRLDGFALCQAIRSDPALADLPVVLASSTYVEQADFDFARRAGANTMVVRTPDLAELIEALRDVRRHPARSGVLASSVSTTEYAERLARQLERHARMNASLSQRCALQAAELTVLGGIAQTLTRRGDLSEAMDEILARCLDAGGLSVGMLYLGSPATGFRAASYVGPVEDRAARDHFFGHSELLRAVAESGRPLLIPSEGVPERSAAEVLKATKGTSMLLVPVSSTSEVLGVLVLVSTRHQDIAGAEWLAFTQAVAAQLGQALTLARAFDAVDTSERRYRGVFDAARDGIALTDAEDRILEANPALCAMSGYGEPDLRGRRFAEWVPSFPPAAREPGAPGLVSDHSLHCRDGSQRTVTITSGRVGPDLHIAVVHDVTESRRLQAQLAQTEKLSAMGQLLAGVAHELNNPLTIVAGHASILRQSATPDIVERAEKISDAAKRCSRIVRNFLSLARQRPPEREPTSLNQVAREAAELLAYQLRVDNVEVAFDLAGSLPILWADPHQLHQVVVNLVGNAHHALRNGSRPRRITIRTGYDAVAHRVALTISDNGPGIPPEIVDRIFEPFFTTKPPGEGTGLGLSLCRGIIASHDGTMRVEPAPGAGVSFIIELPLGARAAAMPEPQAAHAQPAVEGKTILVVDDEAEIADLLSDILTREGHHVDKAPNGAIALEKLRTAQYDLVLSDIKMPEMDGPALYRALEQRYPGLTKRFIFISGDVLSGETARFIESSGLPALNKPFVAPDVRAIIQRVLGAP